MLGMPLPLALLVLSDLCSICQMILPRVVNMWQCRAGDKPSKESGTSGQERDMLQARRNTGWTVSLGRQLMQLLVPQTSLLPRVDT